MSIIHEALKKAQQHPRFSAGTESITKVSFSAGSSPRYAKKNIVKGMTAVGGISLLIWLFFLSDFPLQNETIRNNPVENKKVQIVAQGSDRSPGEPLGGNEAREGVKKADVRVILDQGMTFFKNGQFDEAEKQFLKVIELDPRTSQPHNALGLVYKTIGKMELAEKHYQEALALDPDFAEALNNMAVLYELNGQDAEALEYFRKALSVRTDYPEAHLNIALLLEKLGKSDQAKEEYLLFLSHASSDQKELIHMVKKRINRL